MPTSSRSERKTSAARVRVLDRFLYNTPSSRWGLYTVARYASWRAKKLNLAPMGLPPPHLHTHHSLPAPGPKTIQHLQYCFYRISLPDRLVISNSQYPREPHSNT